ncbi:MAG: hypothetical protein FRX48_05003 [Lasallia pustulata]|uniref:Uncharacterized protein n=1 Tax=Lasallia pustulata TaxID=136370 RepID=A0A5M8PRQ0_9LECA|nr:MAG: hypothetical protein FRX48_05003 [Lasallia pustulata]
MRSACMAVQSSEPSFEGDLTSSEFSAAPSKLAITSSLWFSDSHFTPISVSKSSGNLTLGLPSSALALFCAVSTTNGGLWLLRFLFLVSSRTSSLFSEDGSEKAGVSVEVWAASEIAAGGGMILPVWAWVVALISIVGAALLSILSLTIGRSADGSIGGSSVGSLFEISASLASSSSACSTSSASSIPCARGISSAIASAPFVVPCLVSASFGFGSGSAPIGGATTSWVLLSTGASTGAASFTTSASFTACCSCDGPSGVCICWAFVLASVKRVTSAAFRPVKGRPRFFSSSLSSVTFNLL